MELHIKQRQPGWLGAWLQERCHQILASARLYSDATYGDRIKTRTQATVRHLPVRESPLATDRTG